MQRLTREEVIQRLTGDEIGLSDDHANLVVYTIDSHIDLGLFGYSRLRLEISTMINPHEKALDLIMEIAEKYAE